MKRFLFTVLTVAAGVVFGGPTDNYTLLLFRYYKDGALISTAPNFVSGQTGTIINGSQITHTANDHLPEGYHLSNWWLGSHEIMAGTGTKYKEWSDVSSITVTYGSAIYDKVTSNALELIPSIAQNTYDYAYDANGGSWVSGQPAGGSDVAYWAQQTAAALSCVTRRGHTPTHWLSSLNAAIADGAKFTGSTLGKPAHAATVTLAAQWAPNTYTWTIAPGEGGTGGASGEYTFSPTQAQDSSITLPTRDGYHIGSWICTDHDGSTPTISGTTLTIPANTLGNFTLTPTWEEDPTPTYALTLSDDGHGSVSSFPTGSSFAEGTQVRISAEPDTGYAFAQWLSTGSPATVYENPYVFTIAGDIQFLALFTQRVCRVTFDARGGTCSESSRMVTYGAQIGALPTPTRTGRGFGGWFDDPDTASATKITQTYVVTSDITIYAGWGDAVKDTITAVASPAAGGTVTGGGAVEQGEAVTLTATPNTGYTFTAWQDGTTTNPLTFTAASNATYTATFTPNQYTLLLIPSPGSCSEVLRTVTYDSTYGAEKSLPTPTPLDGYSFEGWYLGTEKITDDTVVKITANYTQLTANYTELPPPEPTATTYTLHFNGQAEGLYGTMTNANGTSGIALALPPCTFTNLVSEFGGWAETPTGSAWCDGKTNIIYTAQYDGEVKELYAVWPGVGTLATQVGLTNAVLVNTSVGMADGWKVTGAPAGCVHCTVAHDTPASDYATLTMNIVGSGVIAFDWQTEAWVAEQITATFTADGTAHALDAAETKATHTYAITGEGFQTIAWHIAPTTTKVANQITALLSAIRWYPGATTYTLQFAKGAADASGTMTPLTDCLSTEPVTLPACDFTRLNYTFAGWGNGNATNQPGDAFLNPSGHDVTLTALWQIELSDLSKAVGLTNAVLLVGETQSGNGWKDYQSNKYDKCTFADECANDVTNTLYMCVTGPGQLSFDWTGRIEATDGAAWLDINGTRHDLPSYTGESSSTIQHEEFAIPAGAVTITWCCCRYADTYTGDALIRNVVWAPHASPFPVPTQDDAQDVTAITAGADAIGFAFNSSADFAYALRGTNTLTVARPWPIHCTTNGTGAAILLTIPRTSEAQMFYYLETRQRTE